MKLVLKWIISMLIAIMFLVGCEIVGDWLGEKLSQWIDN